MKLDTYLNFGGNCAEAFAFYAQHLGATIQFSMTWDQMPEPKTVPPGFESKILHISMDLGGAKVMGADVPGYQPMRSVYLTLAVKSNEEAESLYKLLSDGGEIFMKMEETFFAHRFAMLRDKFGISWMIIHDRPAPSA